MPMARVHAGCVQPRTGRARVSSVLCGWRVRTRARRRLRAASGCCGFTLIELVISIGIIMILVGMLLPSLSGAMSQAKLTRDIALVRQHAAMITLYTGDFKETYPFPYHNTGHLYQVARDFAMPMIEAGYFDSVYEVDPDLDGSGDRYFSYQMSLAMIYNADEMRPGFVRGGHNQTAQATRTFGVLFPSSKGLVLRESNGLMPALGGTGFCCGIPAWTAPVAFSDGSSTSGTYADFLGGDPLIVDEGIGKPIQSTWFGIRGRDR